MFETGVVKKRQDTEISNDPRSVLSHIPSSPLYLSSLSVNFTNLRHSKRGVLFLNGPSKQNCPIRTNTSFVVSKVGVVGKCETEDGPVSDQRK